MVESIFETSAPPSFPPLIRGVAVTGAIDPFVKACAMAALGCDSGVLVHNLAPDRLRAAIVFAPEVPLEQAMSALATCGVAFQTALGALAPPEVAVHLTWVGDILVNGAACGRLRATASGNDPQAVPDWLVIGAELQLVPATQDEPGLTPERTSLYQEGCGEVSPVRLLENWSRHILVWINSTEVDGPGPLHREWRGLVHGIGDTTRLQHDGQNVSGTFLGVDENFGMLLRQGEDTRLIPLTARLEKD
jgi:BirA family transcriptional regulator, biotin operon repressor / biotin---[acetyl-CoA-carboxylase] ligase